MLSDDSSWGLSAALIAAAARFSSAVFTNLSLIMMPLLPHAEFWISHPLSGFLSIATYIGSPWFIQWPPFPYHREIDSSTHIISDGWNVDAL
jgi:hypothetical protein